MSGVELPQRMERGPLAVRLWEPADAPAMSACVAANVSWLARFMPWVDDEPLSTARRLELLARWRSQFDAGLDATYGIWVDGEVAGGCGLHQRVGPGGLEIGYWVDHRVARRRVAATTAALLTTAALGAPGIGRVEIHHAIENRPSAGVPQLLGYRRIGEVADPPMVAGLSGIKVVWRMTQAQMDRGRRRFLADIAIRPA